MIPEDDLRRVKRWAEQRVPPHARHQVRVEVEVSYRAIAIVEVRAPWREHFGPEWTRLPIARMRYTKCNRGLDAVLADRKLRFHRYEDAPATRDIDELIAVVHENRTGIFWG